MFTAEHGDIQNGGRPVFNDKVHDEVVDGPTNRTDPQVIHDHPIDIRNDMMYNWTEENVISLFFNPSPNVPDLSLDFEWLFDNVSTESNPFGEPVMVSRERSVSASNISPPSFPMHAPQISPYYDPTQLATAPWVAVQGRLLEALNMMPAEVLMSPFFYPSNLLYFYNLYFENYHPHFPIIHKPTLDPTKASPLLMTAIVTLGSTLSSDVAHFEAAVKIHDSFRYIIFNVSYIGLDLFCC